MWIELAFIVWKLPVCEVRISPIFSRILWCSPSECSWRAVSAGEMRLLPLPQGQNSSWMCNPCPGRMNARALLPAQGELPAFWHFSGRGLVSFLEQLSIQNTVATWRAAGPWGCPDTGRRILERTRGAAAAKASPCWSSERSALRAAASDSGPGIVLVSFLQRSGRSLHHFQ